MKKYFRILCGLTLSCALFVILWGAWVRFSHSGDGCGMNWPLCNDQWVPQTNSNETWIEWIHRVSALIFSLFIVCLALLGFKIFPKKHKVRLWIGLTVLFSLLEALIGAGLVLFGLTGANNSLTRLIVLNIHLLNSLCLVAGLVFCWRFSFDHIQISLKKLIFPICLYFLIAGTGSITSLSNTLFPSSSLAQGWMMDLNSKSHWLVQLRIIHPFLALLIGGFFWKLTDRWRHRYKKNENKNIFLAGCLFLSLTTGLITLLTLSPVALKIIHIFFAYLLWIAFIWLA